MSIIIYIALWICLIKTFISVLYVIIEEKDVGKFIVGLLIMVFIFWAMSLLDPLKGKETEYTINMYQSVEEYICELDKEGVSYSIRQQMLDDLGEIEGTIVIIDRLK